MSLFQDGLHTDLSQGSQEREADRVGENTGKSRGNQPHDQEISSLDG